MTCRRWVNRILSVVLADVILGMTLFGVLVIIELTVFGIVLAITFFGLWTGIGCAAAMLGCDVVFFNVVIRLGVRAWSLPKELWTGAGSYTPASLL